MADVGFLGAGAIAAAMVAGLAGDGHRIRVASRGGASAEALAAAHPKTRALSNAAVVAESEILFLCLPPAAARPGLAGLPFRADHRIVSVMLGVSCAELAAICAPASEISIAIPLPMIAKGGCPLPVHPPSPALDALFGARNLILPLENEASLAPHFAVTALCSTTLDQMRAGAGWLARATGDARAAEAYVTAMLAGALAALETDGAARIDAALDALSIEGGLNATLRAHMRARGAVEALEQGLDGFRGRLGMPEAPALKDRRT
ncbi:MAG: NAD(P)-binding domain-containing protein [Pseudomonadota bacterium]